MSLRRRTILGFVFAAVYAAASALLRTQIVAYGPPRTLDIFLVGIALTSYFFSWIAAAALLAASLVISMDTFAMAGPGDELRLALYVCGAAGLIWAFRHLKQALARSRQTEQTNRLVLEHASDGIFLCAPDGTILDANQAACTMLGYSRERLLAMKGADLDAGARGNPLETAGAAPEDRRLRHAAGAEVLAEISSQRIADGRIIAVVRDITERARSREAVSRSEALTRSVVYTAVDGIVTCDESGTITLFNPAAEKLFGFSGEEAVGRNISLLTAEASPWRLAPGEQQPGAWGRRKDGTVFPIDLAVSEMALPEGRMFTAIIRDVTDRRQAEEALRQAHEALRAVIETSPLAIFTMDLEGHVTSWNPAAERIFGYTEAEVRGRVLPTVPENERASLSDAIASARAGRFMAGSERRRLRKDGSFVDVSIWNAALRSSAGEITGLMSVVADVTERRQLEEQLNQSQRMDAVGRLAGGMAHDFNNILTVISGYSRMMLDTMPPDSPWRADVQEIIAGSEHATRLTGQLLTFSRRQKVAAKVIDLNSVIASMEEIVRGLVGEDVQVVPDLSPDLGCVKVDPGQIEQVILNLAANARDAMSRGGRLTIETSNLDLNGGFSPDHPPIGPGSYVTLAVTDTGRGMTPEERSRLFEPFFTTKPKGSGTGLGLSTVYGIVKQANGDILVRSEPGAGTTVRIYLPRTAEAPEPDEAEAAASPDVRGTETVLLVEDDGTVRKLVRDILLHHGYRVLEADDPAHALRLCGDETHRIDLLLTDVVMPGMSGRELAEKALDILPGLRVLYMSGYTDNVMTSYGLQSAQTHFLAKPFTPVALSRKVRQVLDA